MVAFTDICLIVENISSKDVIIFGSFRLRPGATTDLFKAIPGLSESRVIDALRSPTGELYLLCELHRKIVIKELRLALFDNMSVDSSHLKVSNSPGRGKVLGFDGGQLK